MPKQKIKELNFLSCRAKVYKDEIKSKIDSLDCMVSELVEDGAGLPNFNFTKDSSEFKSISEQVGVEIDIAVDNLMKKNEDVLNLFKDRFEEKRNALDEIYKKYLCSFSTSEMTLTARGRSSASPVVEPLTNDALRGVLTSLYRSYLKSQNRKVKRIRRVPISFTKFCTYALLNEYPPRFSKIIPGVQAVVKRKGGNDLSRMERVSLNYLGIPIPNLKVEYFCRNVSLIDISYTNRGKDEKVVEQEDFTNSDYVFDHKGYHCKYIKKLTEGYENGWALITDFNKDLQKAQTLGESIEADYNEMIKNCRAIAKETTTVSDTLYATDAHIDLISVKTLGVILEKGYVRLRPNNMRVNFKDRVREAIHDLKKQRKKLKITKEWDICERVHRELDSEDLKSTLKAKGSGEIKPISKAPVSEYDSSTQKMLDRIAREDFLYYPDDDY
jgi:hypothetical protein